MKICGCVALLLLSVIDVQSDVNYDHYIMSEAYIQEYRAKEDRNAGYMPFFAECNAPPNDGISGCKPAIPILSDKEGYAMYVASLYANSLNYGCYQEINTAKVYNSQYFKKAIVLNHAIRTKFPTQTTPRPSWFQMHLNVYKYTCTSEISPTIWRTADGLEGSYHIGYQVIQHNDIPLADVLFDHTKLIPLRTKHTLYGASLAAPIDASNSIEKLVYQNIDGTHLEDVSESYYKFNAPNSDVKKKYNAILKKYNAPFIPEESKISIAHLIPEYDMVDTSWQKVSRFAQTIAPMWTVLYLRKWISVEETLRAYSFLNEKNLTVYTGTHGQLTLNKDRVTTSEEDRKFFLSANNVVPELFWKLAITESKNENDKQEAVVIILHNLTVELDSLQIFDALEAPCISKCLDLHWDSIDAQSMYCCRVEEVRGLINEFPDTVKSEDVQFDALSNNVR